METNAPSLPILHLKPLAVNCYFVSRRVSIALIALCAAFSCVYLLVQELAYHRVEDSFFVVFAVIGITYLSYAIRTLYRFISTAGHDCYSYLSAHPSNHEAEAEYRSISREVFHSRRMAVCAAIYAIPFSLMPFVFGEWSKNLTLRLLLAAILYVYTFLTGAAIYGLAVFFVKLIKLATILHIGLWEKENPSTHFLLGSVRRIAILTGVYTAISVSSIAFSVLPHGRVILAFTLYGAFIVVLALTLPTWVVIGNLGEQKRSFLGHIDSAVQQEFGVLIARTVDKGGDLENVQRLDHLLKMRAAIEDAHIFPFRTKTLATAVSMVVIAWIPAVLQVGLGHLWR